MNENWLTEIEKFPGWHQYDGYFRILDLDGIVVVQNKIVNGSSIGTETKNGRTSAIEVSNIMGLGLPACNGTWPGGGGSNLGTFGQYLRNMTLPVGVSRNTSGGSAPTNKKGC